MRIGFDAKRATMNFTGLGNYSRSLIQNLGLFYPDNFYTLFTPSLPNISLYPTLFDKNRYQFILPKTPLAKWAKGLWRTFSLQSLLEKENLDIYHGLSGELPWNPSYNLKSSTRQKTKYIVTVHDLIFFRYPQYYKSLDRMIYRKKLIYACKRADHIIAVSDQTKKDLLNYLKIKEEKISVIYQVCDPRFWEKSTPTVLAETRINYQLPPRFILYVGTIEPRKNALELVKAFHKIRDSGLKDVQLILIGKKTSYFDLINSFVKVHKLENFIRFFSDLPNEILPHFYQMAELFVYPSTFEGFGIPILEAIVSGTPVITSLGSCFSEAGGEGSLYINPKDINQLSNALMYVMNNKSLQETMRDKGYIHAHQFEAKPLSQKLMNLYQKLIKS